MTEYGYIRVGAGVPEVNVADIEANVEAVIASVRSAGAQKVALLALPELCITGYTCGDLFGQTLLQKRAAEGLRRIASQTASEPVAFAVGLPVATNMGLYNCAAFVACGQVLGLVPKSYVPNYSEFYEQRWFRSAPGREESLPVPTSDLLADVPFGTDLMFEVGGARVAVEICEDLWVPVSPGSLACMAGADIVLNLSATDEVSGKHAYLRNLISQQSARCRCGYVYASAGFGESSTDLVFAGNAIVAEDGVILAEAPRFQTVAHLATADIDVDRLRSDRMKTSTFGESQQAFSRDYRIVDTHLRVAEPDDIDRKVDARPFVPESTEQRAERCEEIISIQAMGLMKRLKATGCEKLVVGVSGGLDSTLALLVAVRAFDRLWLSRSGIYAITMPGFGTSSRTHENAKVLMERLGVTSVEIPIADAVRQHFADIGHDESVHDVVYENAQARERTQILMDFANKVGGMVLGTGDLSELALGWATYNGDQMSMYGVNASVPKTLVRHLVRWIADTDADQTLARTLHDIVDTPVSPELLPANADDTIAQCTEDLVGPYELHDFFLYNMLRYGFAPKKIYALARKAFAGEYSDATIMHWLRTFVRRFFAQQFKRSCMPDGPKVGSVCLSPRGDWRMPSDASARMWLSSLDSIYLPEVEK